MDMQGELQQHIRDVADFPKPGIIFKDIGPLLKHRLPESASAMLALFTAAELAGIDHIVGLDARGFIFGAAMSAESGAGFVMARKAGKLPPPAHAVSYALEYGEATIEVQDGTGRILIVDDVIATGGTLAAAAEAATKAGYEVAGFATLINLRALNDFSWNGLRCRSVLHYD